MMKDYNSQSIRQIQIIEQWNPVNPVTNGPQISGRIIGVPYPTPLPVFAPSNFSETSYEFEEKTLKTFEEKSYKNSTGRENYKLGVSEDVH